MSDTRPDPPSGRTTRLARRLWPGLSRLGRAQRREGVASLLTALYAGPPALAALIWLVAVQPVPWPWAAGPATPEFLALAVSLLAARQILAAFSPSLGTGRWDSPASRLLARLPVWSAALVYGPGLLWLDVAGALLDAWIWRRGRLFSARQRWRMAADVSWAVARDTLPALAALALFPAGQGALFSLGLALSAGLVRAGLGALLLLPLIILLAAAEGRPAVSLTGFLLRLRAAAVWLRALMILLLTDLAAASGAAFLAQALIWPYLLFLGALLAVSALLHAAESRAHRSQERFHTQAGLAALDRELLEAGDEEAVAAALTRRVPALFPEGLLSISLFPDRLLVHHPDDFGQERPPSVHVPIGGRGGGETLGTIEWQPGPEVAFGSAGFAEVFEALRQLADHLAVTLYRLAAVDEALTAVAEAYQSELYAELVKAEINQAYRQVSQELALAGRIQAGFLPRTLPELPGWQLTAALEPARQTSGDFYDVIELPGGLLGLLVADVTDKGIGPALYAAISRTLIRTYALEYGMAPARVLQSANRRILADAGSDLFVTVFYGVLDPHTGELAYCNAGHNPPYHWPGGRQEAAALGRTALPLGILEGDEWEEGRTRLEPGDLLLMYTDGLVEAQDEQGRFFGEQGLQAAVGPMLGRPVQVIEDRILSAVTTFAGDAPQFDDLTLMILARER
jgi:serine phosphatase RsbU (regulator of sigma subunit)